MHARGHTPLTWAAVCGHRHALQRLLRLGARLDVRDRDRRRLALHIVASRADTEAVKWLIDEGLQRCGRAAPRSLLAPTPASRG